MAVFDSPQVSVGAKLQEKTLTSNDTYTPDLGYNGFSEVTVNVPSPQVTELPVASAEEEGNIYQFVGITDSTYTNGYFYKCVSDGLNPAIYSWTQVDVQPAGSSLPSQSGNAGKFLTTDGTDASWATINALQNTATGTDALCILGSQGSYEGVSVGVSSKAGQWAVAVGKGSVAHDNGIAIGNGASAANNFWGAIAIGKTAQTTRTGIAIGYQAKITASGAIQLGSKYNNLGYTNSDEDTFKVGNGYGNYEIMSANGTIPTDRFTTTPSADGTYVPTLTISSGTATRSWTTPGGGGGATSATATLAVNDWSSNTQTVNVTGVTASNFIMVSPAPSSVDDYVAADIRCTAQGSGTLTFTCATVPSNAITVNVGIFG